MVSIGVPFSPSFVRGCWALIWVAMALSLLLLLLLLCRDLVQFIILSVVASFFLNEYFRFSESYTFSFSS